MRQLGWANVRDHLIFGELDAAHAPAGLLLAPSWLVFSYRVGGDYGTPAALLQFLPTALLLVLSACLRRAGAASPSKATNRSNPKEAR